MFFIAVVGFADVGPDVVDLIDGGNAQMLMMQA